MLTIIDKLLFLYVFSIYLYSIFFFSYNVYWSFVKAVWERKPKQSDNPLQASTTVERKTSLSTGRNFQVQGDHLMSWKEKRQRKAQENGTKHQVWAREGKNEWCSGVHKHLVLWSHRPAQDVPHMFPRNSWDGLGLYYTTRSLTYDRAWLFMTLYVRFWNSTLFIMKRCQYRRNMYKEEEWHSNNPQNKCLKKSFAETENI